MSNHQKSTRSRFSSPLQLSSSPSGHNRASANNEKRTFMQRWLEPPLQNKASYQEAGLMKAGVVENMAPLGTLPKAAITKKSGMHGDHAHGGATPLVKKIVLKKPKPSVELSAPVIADESRTPPLTLPGASPDVEDADVMMLSPSSRPFLLPPIDDGEDEDYLPQKPSTKLRTSSFSASNKAQSNPLTSTDISGMNAAATRRQSSRRKSARPSPPPPSSPIQSAPSVSTQASPSRMLPPPQSSATPSRTFEEKQLADKIVEQAVEQAIDHCRYPTAYALRNLYDERFNDPQFVSMIIDIYYQRVDPAILREFGRLVLEKKRFGKKHNYAFEYFVPEEIPIPKPKPAPYASLVTMDLSVFKEVAPDADGRATKKIKIEKPSDPLPNLVPVANPNFNAKTDAKTGGNAINGNLELPLDSITKTSIMDSTPNPTIDAMASATPAVNDNTIDAPTTSAPATGGPALSAPVISTPAVAAPAVGIRTHDTSSVLSTAAAKLATAASGPNGIKNTKSPRGRKKRSGSVSSISSLSSVPDDVPEDYDEFMVQVDDDLAVSRPRSAEGNDTPNPAGSFQPISASHKKSSGKKKNASPKLVTRPSTTHNTPNPSERSMSAVVTINGASHHQGSRQTPAPLRFPSKFGDLDAVARGWSTSKLERRHENRRLTTAATSDSHVRPELVDEEPHKSVLPAAPPPTVVAPAEQLRPSRTPALSSRAARAAKRNHDEVDDSISPTAASFQARLEASSSRRNSRAATPSNLQSAKKPRGGLRVKTSPMKKKGTSAGIPRGGGERPSPAANGTQHQDDNDDSCYTCGGNGELVCCDGCTYSFHFLCIDPPMSEGHMPDEWYCNECSQRYFPPIGERQGAFSDLLTALGPKNPRAFRLPEDVREHFEGVKTGPEGEFEDSTLVAKPKTNKKGYEESLDYFRTKNPDGSAALCHHCHKGAADNRPLLICSVPSCGLNWHLECLDPPLAVPPVPRTWRCPAHVDDLLRTLPGRSGTAHKYRKVKDAPIIEPIYSRGMANNGWIEIEEDSDDDDDDDDAWRHRKSYGRVFRVPEKGVKLDFLSRVHENRRKTQTPTRAATPNPAFPVAFSARSLAEQQAALNLSQLAQGGNDGVNQLIQALVSEASPSMVSVMAHGDAERIAAGNLATADVTALTAMLAQADSFKSAISKILASRTNPATPGAHPATPAETPEKTSATSDLVSGDGATLGLSRNAAQDQVGDKTTGAKDDSAMQVD